MSNTLIQQQSYLTNVIKISLGVLGLFASAQINIPIQPVPITLQTVAVMLIGLTYLPKQAISTLMLYLLIGAVGGPVFTKFNYGITYMTGPTGGYLLGFFIAAVAMAYLRQHMQHKFLNILLLCCVGHVIIYLLGISWLSQYVGAKKALYLGGVVYVPSGIAKILILSFILKFTRNT